MSFMCLCGLALISIQTHLPTRTPYVIGCFTYRFSTPTRTSTSASMLGKLGQKLGHEIGVGGGIVHKTTTCYPDFYPNFCPNSVPQLRLIGDLGHPSSRFGA
ncbi:hypothetical protein B0H16DRAFT_1594210 [Mycena metata]|uniref:Secreted protein n=1 Tax=Mycena metata TaxID=1033252 RepID=A0AAD7HQ18_9AGAR|nr:hypothetical protein B0H16DRAFT_1594210 [Mycena metata]